MSAWLTGHKRLSEISRTSSRLQSEVNTFAEDSSTTGIGSSLLLLAFTSKNLRFRIVMTFFLKMSGVLMTGYYRVRYGSLWHNCHWSTMTPKRKSTPFIWYPCLTVTITRPDYTISQCSRSVPIRFRNVKMSYLIFLLCRRHHLSNSAPMLTLSFTMRRKKLQRTKAPSLDGEPLM